jgi:hypothetical protein
VAQREFEEETGARPHGNLLAPGEVVQAGRKIVTAWALEGDFDPATLISNRFELEWPPKSGRKASFPEVDRAQWFSPAEARQKMLPAQREFITRLLDALGAWRDFQWPLYRTAKGIIRSDENGLAGWGSRIRNYACRVSKSAHCPTLPGRADAQHQLGDAD